jgi:hypothetical protein
MWKGREIRTLEMKYLRSFYTLIKYFLNIYFNISLPSAPKPSNWSLSFRYSYRNLGRISFRLHTCYMPCPSYSFLFGYSNNIWRRENSEMFIRGYVKIMGLVKGLGCDISCVESSDPSVI